MADKVPNWSPEQAEAAQRLAERKIQEAEARLPGPNQKRLTEIRAERDELIARFGGVWATQYIRIEYPEIDEMMRPSDVTVTAPTAMPTEETTEEVSAEAAPVTKEAAILEVADTTLVFQEPGVNALTTPVETTEELVSPQTATIENAEVQGVALIDRVLWPIAEYALRVGSSFRMEEIRRNVPEIAALSPASYQYVKNRFSIIRERIAEELTDKGVPVTWDVDTSKGTRGVRYQLLEISRPDLPKVSPRDVVARQRAAEQTPANIVTTTPAETERIAPAISQARARAEVKPAAPSEPMKIEDMTPEQLREVPIVRAILNTANILNQTNPNATTRSNIAKRVADEMGVTRQVAEHFIDLARSKEILFTNGRKYHGSHLFSTERPVDAPKPNGEQRAPEASKQPTPEEVELMVLDDIEVATVVLDELATLKHANQTLEVKEILALPIFSGMEDKKARDTVQRLRRAGIVQWQTKIRPAGRHGKRLEVPHIKFPSQSAKERWEKNRKSVLEAMPAKLRRDYLPNGSDGNEISE